VGDVCDVHPCAEAVALAGNGDRVVEVLGGLGVDGERHLVPKVDAAFERRLGRVVRLVPLGQAFVLEQRVEDSLDRVRGAERLLEPCAALARRDDGQLARPDVGEPAAIKDERNARRKERLADDEAAAPADLDDQAVRQWIRPRSGESGAA
jgi:hypothetical protein